MRKGIWEIVHQPKAYQNITFVIMGARGGGILSPLPRMIGGSFQKVIFSMIVKRFPCQPVTYCGDNSCIHSLICFYSLPGLQHQISSKVHQEAIFHISLLYKAFIYVVQYTYQYY